MAIESDNDWYTKYIESDNLYDWYTKYSETYPLEERSEEDFYDCAMESGYTRSQIDELVADIEQGGDDYAKLHNTEKPLSKKLGQLNKKTGLFEKKETYEMKHLQTFERFYDLNDDIGAAINPDECCTACEGSGKLPVSNCCGAPCIEETDICSHCKEHCECPSDCDECEGTGMKN